MPPLSRSRLRLCSSRAASCPCRTCATSNSPRTVRLSAWRRCSGRTSSPRSESRCRSSCSSEPLAPIGPSPSGWARVSGLLVQEALPVPLPHTGTGLKVQSVRRYFSFRVRPIESLKTSQKLLSKMWPLNTMNVFSGPGSGFREDTKLPLWLWVRLYHGLYPTLWYSVLSVLDDLLNLGLETEDNVRFPWKLLWIFRITTGWFPNLFGDELTFSLEPPSIKK